MPENQLFIKIARLQQTRQSFALVTVIATKGSTPREAGAKMIVLANGETIGTIGGSAVESLVLRDALTALRDNKIVRCSYDLNDLEKTATGMICGGTMEFYIEPVKPAPRLFIFGGGHCGQPLARAAAQVGFACTIVEDRPEFAGRERFPEAAAVIAAKPDAAFGQISFEENDYVAVLTRNHELDYQILKKVITHKLAYVGLIGSKAKRAQIFKKLVQDGLAKTDLDRVHCPIGLAIGADSPEEIAVSIVAQLIAVKNGVAK